MREPRFVRYSDYREYPVEEMRRRATSFLEELRRRRTVRDYAPRPVPRDVIESCLLAAGTAPSGANLATLTHTPSPMGFLNDVLGRPANERPFLLLVVGYPAVDTGVPVIEKKPLADIAVFI